MTDNIPHSRAQSSPAWQLPVLIALSVLLILTLLWLGFEHPDLSHTQCGLVRVLLAIAAGGIAAIIPGRIETRIPGAVSAVGAIAVVVLVIYIFDCPTPNNSGDSVNGSSQKASQTFGKYGSVSDAKLGQWIVDEAAKVEAKADKARADAEAAYSPNSAATPGGVRFQFSEDIKSCCFQAIRDLREEAHKRLGPSSQDSDEIRAFQMLEQQIGEDGVISATHFYVPHFRILGEKLKRMSSSLIQDGLGVTETIARIRIVQLLADVVAGELIALKVRYVNDGDQSVKLACKYGFGAYELPPPSNLKAIDNLEELVWNSLLNIKASGISDTPSVGERTYVTAPPKIGLEFRDVTNITATPEMIAKLDQNYAIYFAGQMTDGSGNELAKYCARLDKNRARVVTLCRNHN